MFGWCCNDCGCSLACDCTDSDCFSLDSPPTWAACGSNAAALALIEEAFNGVLRKHDDDSCSWWSSACGDIGGGVTAGYAVELRLDLAACNWALEFFQSCDLGLSECCVDTGAGTPPSADPNIAWTLLARYTFGGGTFNCSSGGNLFDLASDVDGCDDCADGGVDISWPSTLELTAGVTCGSSVPGGSGCGSCCDKEDESLGSTLTVTIASSCSMFNGLSFSIIKDSGTTWGNVGTPVSIACSGESNCGFIFTLACLAATSTHPQCFGAGINVNCSGCGIGENIFFGNEPCEVISGSCDPFSVLMVLKFNSGCGSCSECLLEVTITD